MKAVKIIYKSFNTTSLLYLVKLVKEKFGLGLREAKDHVDRIREEVGRGSINIGIGSEEYNILIFLREEGYLSFDIDSKVKLVQEKPERKRVVARLTKEQEQAIAWAKSLHPKKRAMINLLIKNTDGI